MGNRRGVRLGLMLVVSAFALTAVSVAQAGGDDGELLDVTKALTSLEKKMDELRAHGRWAREGALSLSAVCREHQASSVFAPWGDSASYVPAPEGDFESSSGWTLDKHASLSAENSPFSPGQASLFLGEKGEAISPAMCVSTLHPSFRFFSVNGGSAESKLEIEVLYEGVDGKVKRLKVARLEAGSSWSPSRSIPLHVNMLAAASQDGFTAVAFKFKAHGAKSEDGGWLIDDLFVDPFLSR
jgi:hypothetical protein